MEKTKLAVCMEDEEYRQRFVRCMIKHYKDLFEIHVVNKVCELHTQENETIRAVIVGDDNDKYLEFSKDYICLVLQEVRKECLDINENIYYTDKYQEVYKIVKELQKVITKKTDDFSICVRQKELQRIGVFSLSKESMQLPFSVLLAEILGENHEVMFIDLQPFSGFIMDLEMEGSLGMEDLMSIAAREQYTAARLNASIGHEQKWEFIYPAKNASCFSDVGLENYQKLFSLLERELAYTYEIVNFGSMCSGMLELMESCQEIYMLTEKKEERNDRENHFLEEMRYRGKENLLQKIIWMEIPMGFGRTVYWKALVKQWLWSSLGDKIRERYWVEYADRRDM